MKIEHVQHLWKKRKSRNQNLFLNLLKSWEVVMYLFMFLFVIQFSASWQTIFHLLARTTPHWQDFQSVRDEYGYSLTQICHLLSTEQHWAL